MTTPAIEKRENNPELERSNIKWDEEVFAFPIGTKQEAESFAERIGLDPGKVACCGPSRTGEAMGCPMWKRCKFRDLKGRGGPEYRGVYRIPTNPSNWQSFVLPCYTIEATLRERMAQGAELGEAYSRFYMPGETIRQRLWEKEHVIKEKNCQKCQAGTCNKMKEVVIEHTIPKFPRPAERFKNLDFIESVQDDIVNAADFDQKLGTLIERTAARPKHADLTEVPDDASLKDKLNAHQ
jgi:hypothetical protein